MVRAVRGTGADVVEGPPSPTACVKPVDVFPPEPPTGLSAVAGEGAISLIWEASTSDDVAGYLVLRGEGADATLLPVTPSPVVETRFVDRDGGGRHAIRLRGGGRGRPHSAAEHQRAVGARGRDRALNPEPGAWSPEPDEMEQTHEALR